MSVSIQSCPSCRTLLLSDTIQCPLCQHVINPDLAGTHDFLDAIVVEQEVEGLECGDCGEIVRPELVRCWRCGAFLRAEIAERYMEMQRRPAPIIYSQRPSDSKDAALFSPQQSRVHGESDVASVDDDDFELAEGVHMSDDDFELDRPLLPKPSLELTPEPLSETSPEPETAEASDEDDQGDETDAGAEGDAGAESDETEPDAESPKAGESAGDEETGEETGEEAGEEAGGRAGDEVDQAIATGGDALLDIAMAEEAESSNRRRTQGTTSLRGSARAIAKTGFIVFCPNGHSIEVQERHRGKTGKCPKCRSQFYVPAENWDHGRAGVTKEQPKADVAVESESLYPAWLDDVHLHQVDLSRLKLKLGSLATGFDTVDVGFSRENILMVKLAKGGGLFGGGGGKKVEEFREAVRIHVEEVRSIEGLPVAESVLLSRDTVSGIAVVQPAPYRNESVFRGIAVFGEGRIAVRLPDEDEQTEDYLSFHLTEFRVFSQQMTTMFGIESFGATVGVPLVDDIVEVTCHYSEEKMSVASQIEYYDADPNYEVTLVGWRCEGCALIVSEDSRKKEKIGGKAGKMKKAVCPKCKHKFGDNPLHEVHRLGEDKEEDEGSPESGDADASAGSEGTDPSATAETPESEGAVESAGESSGDSADEAVGDGELADEPTEDEERPGEEAS